MSAAFNHSINTDDTSEFRNVANKVAEIAGAYGVKVVGYHDPELPLFHALSRDKQKEALRLLKAFLQSLEATEASGKKLTDQSSSTWGALSTMGLIPPADLFRHFVPSALIEIYDPTGLQIWRNFNFMKFCSYTLEEIYSLEWFRRYKRDAAIDQECFTKVGALLSGQTPEIYFPEIGEHILEEACSQDRLKFSATYEIFCTLKNRKGEVAAWLVMTSAKIIGKAADPGRPHLNLVPEQPAPGPTPN